MEYHIVFRVDRALKELVFRVARARGELPSDFVRRAVKTELAKLSFLSQEEKKALGISSVLPGSVSGHEKTSNEGKVCV